MKPGSNDVGAAETTAHDPREEKPATGSSLEESARSSCSAIQTDMQPPAELPAAITRAVGVPPTLTLHFSAGRCGTWHAADPLRAEAIVMPHHGGRDGTPRNRCGRRNRA